MVDEIDLKKLGDYFPVKWLKWKPQTVKNNNALAVVFIDARIVQDRLDDVVGPSNWKTDYIVLADGSVECRLSIWVDGEWVGKCDVGSPSEQPDGGDRLKAAYSDSLKRAAVQWGIGRYLYDFPLQWVEYDPQRRQFVNEPKVPDWAIPPVEKINAEELINLDKMIALTKSDKARFCQHYGIKSVADLPKAQYSDVLGTLKKKYDDMTANTTKPTTGN